MYMFSAERLRIYTSNLPIYAFVGRATWQGAEICQHWAENVHVDLPLPHYYAECYFIYCYAECHYAETIMLSVIVLCIVTPRKQLTMRLLIIVNRDHW
jgi:hypothetical protein